MTTLRILLVVSLAACGGSNKDSNSPTGGPGEPAIDPTLPSWAPPSCTTYQKAVFQAINCQAVDQAKRDEVQTAYAADSESWKAETDADASRIEAVDASCTSKAESVRAMIGDQCTAEAK